MRSKYATLFALAVFLSNCQEQPKVPTTKAAANPSAQTIVIQSENKTYKVQCAQIDSALADSEFPMIIKTCLYGKYKIIEKGTADFNGRYGWDQETFVKTNLGFKKVENSVMFIHQDKLLTIINTNLIKDYKTMKSDPRSDNCWRGWGKFVPIRSLNDLQIGFSEDATTMHFSYSLGMPSACLSQDLLFCDMKLEEIDKYVAK